MELNVLMVDDEKKITESIQQILNGKKIKDHTIKLTCTNDFNEGKKLLSKFEYDVVILDIFKGKQSEANPDKPGEEILDEIKNSCFIPVIFFSGLTNHVKHLESGIIRVVTKTAGGNDELIKELEYLLDTNIPLIKKKLNVYTKECMREYFWDFVQNDWKDLSGKDEISLGYLIMRRIAKSLSKEKIAEILGDRNISVEKIYPLEFYIYPPRNTEYETGDIFFKNEKYYIIITPTCTVKKTKIIQLVECTPLKEMEEYKRYKRGLSKSLEVLKLLIESRRGDQFFFLPKTHFIDNLVIDFQKIRSIPISELSDYAPVTKLDDPFAQSMIGYFIRYYNRIGTEDIDSDYIIKNLD